ncbi:hypothetical protein TBR22_A25120 [Luteitalea sp. TBR-22]|uniref:hypothetical protein n=1 Tax=Luteitalea sp. TBR-22 TaxID=2802971 RepID=UPI001AF6B314|nr:hypothetical protein [Luteitalea sp. TBR-22]BCS33285.1 hypothetical protein TBR22_A25120 [Luteitalea sp. TBR-22]
MSAQSPATRRLTIGAATVGVLGTAWLCVASWRVLWLLAVGLWWVTPGVIALRRAYRDTRQPWPLALLLGPPLGFALSSLVLLAVWLPGWHSAWWLVAAPLVACVLAAATPSLGTRLVVPRFDRRDVVAVALVLLLVPAVVARPYSQVGRDLPEGRAYRAYFTADFVWAMAVVSEVSKGDVLPRNPYHVDQPLHYYWLAHLFPALEHRALGRAVRLDHLLLANAAFAAAMFLGFLYGLAKHFARAAVPSALGCVAVVLCTSPEGLIALSDLARQARPLDLVRYLNIDAVDRWIFGALPIDGLQRLLLYQPQHQIGYALACTALLLMAQQGSRPRVRTAAMAATVLGCGLLISTFSALMVATMLALVASVVIVRARAWSTGIAQGAVAAVPLGIAVWASRALSYVVSDDGAPLVTVGLNPIAARHPFIGPLVSLGPVLLLLALGGWWLARTGRRQTRVLIPGVALVVCAFYYYAVDVRDHQDVYVGWRAGHLLLILSSGMIGWTAWRLLHASARRWSAIGVATVALLVTATLPTVVLDLYNSQDLTNRQMAAGFPWTLVLGHDEVNALRWIAERTPLDARVQVDPIARDPATWAYIPAFAERRMSGGLPISMIPLHPYEEISGRIRRMFDRTTPEGIFQEAQALRIDVLLVGGVEKQAHPRLEALLASRPQLFVPMFRTRNVTLYAISGRMRAQVAARR